MKHCVKSYKLEQSPFFRLSNKKRLAELLGVNLKLITDLESSELHKQYKKFIEKETNRLITEPVRELAKVHKTILRLFQRIETPDYLHSAIKKRSYKSNAAVHLNTQKILKIDIKKFFPSISFDHIHHFFLNDMQCSIDIATILAKLASVQTKEYGTHLPTGSCISPLLSYWINKNMFDKLNAVAANSNCKFSLYIDDMTISGSGASRELLSKIASIIYSNRYKYHKTQVCNNGIATVTGLVVHNNELKLPHKRAKKIRKTHETLKKAQTLQEQSKILESLIGMLTEAESIAPAYSQRKNSLLKDYKLAWEIVKNRRSSKQKDSSKVKKPQVDKLEA